MLNACTGLLRGAGYVAFDGGVPEHIEHAAIANEYAHVTAPLRRLVDRYAGEVCVAMCADTDIPTWVRAKLQGLPKMMNSTDPARPSVRAGRASTWSRRPCSPAGSARPSTANVVDLDDKNADKGTVVLTEPRRRGRGDVGPPTSARARKCQVRLVEADVATRKVRFELPPMSD